MLLLTRFDYSRLREFKLRIYGLLIGLNLLVLGLGSVARGSRRWIELPFFQFQPSELGKMLLIVRCRRSSSTARAGCASARRPRG